MLASAAPAAVSAVTLVKLVAALKDLSLNILLQQTLILSFRENLCRMQH